MSKPLLLTEEGVALEGNDPVSYFTEESPVAGSEEISAEFAGAKYLFASEENKTTFEENPEKYAPQVLRYNEKLNWNGTIDNIVQHRQFGGYCATAMSEGKVFPADASSYRVTDDKLYVFFRNEEIETLPKWMENEEERKKLAHGHWDADDYVQ